MSNECSSQDQRDLEIMLMGGCWKAILGSLELFKSLVRFQIGNGSRVLF